MRENPPAIFTVVLMPIVYILLFFLNLPSNMLSAYVLSDVWKWFVTPGFGVEVPAFGYILGLTLIPSFFLYEIQYRIHQMPTKEEEKWHGFFVRPLIVYPAFSLALWCSAWLIKSIFL